MPATPRARSNRAKFVFLNDAACPLGELSNNRKLIGNAIVA